MTDKELTWIATVFDCEGCLDKHIIYHEKKNGQMSEYSYLRIQIGHCSFDLLERFHKLVGMGKIYGPYTKKSGKYSRTMKDGNVRDYDYTLHKKWWKWEIRNEEVRKFMALIWGEWISDYRRMTAIEIGAVPSLEVLLEMNKE